jgi:hypothetical protein
MLEKVIVEDERVKLSTGLLTHSPEEVRRFSLKRLRPAVRGLL